MLSRVVIALTLLAGACEDHAPTQPAATPPAATADAAPEAGLPPPRPLRLADVLLPSTAEEVEAARAYRDGEDRSARDVREETSGTLALGTVSMIYRVLSHTVGGQRHYGVVLVPDGAANGSLPVLVYTHGGYTGEGGLPPYRVEDLQFVVPGQPLRSKLVYVVPAYRGERIEVGGRTFAAAGRGLLGTTDVADTAALVSVALGVTPQANPERIAVFGESRGGLVALALAAHDPRIDLVIDAYGPTDFRRSIEAAGEPAFLASVSAAKDAPDDPRHIVARSLVPVERLRRSADGTLEIDAEGFREMRRRLTATSAVAQARLLPRTEVHHGTADATSAVADSRALRDAMLASGRPSPSTSFTYFEYEGGEHAIRTLPGAVGRIAAALEDSLFPR
jgi:acetyl esterase/lipase